MVSVMFKISRKYLQMLEILHSPLGNYFPKVDSPILRELP
jgi:hypothetical protein